MLIAQSAALIEWAFIEQVILSELIAPWLSD